MKKFIFGLIVGAVSVLVWNSFTAREKNNPPEDGVGLPEIVYLNRTSVFDYKDLPTGDYRFVAFVDTNVAVLRRLTRHNYPMLVRNVPESMINLSKKGYLITKGYPGTQDW